MFEFSFIETSRINFYFKLEREENINTVGGALYREKKN